MSEAGDRKMKRKRRLEELKAVKVMRAKRAGGDNVPTPTSELRVNQIEEYSCQERY